MIHDSRISNWYDSYMMCMSDASFTRGLYHHLGSTSHGHGDRCGINGSAHGGYALSQGDCTLILNPNRSFLRPTRVMLD